MSWVYDPCFYYKLRQFGLAAWQLSKLWKKVSSAPKWHLKLRQHKKGLHKQSLHKTYEAKNVPPKMGFEVDVFSVVGQLYKQKTVNHNVE